MSELSEAFECGQAKVRKALQPKIDALLAAAKAALEVLPGLEVRNWPPGHAMKKQAIEELTAAIAAAEGTDR